MYDISSSVESKSGLSADQLNTKLAGTGLAGLGAAFLALEPTDDINAVFAIAHAAVESAWGRSQLATNRNNLFGINAVDSNPNEAFGYPSKEACIAYYGRFLKADYLTPGGAYYEGPTLHDIFVHYSSSHDAEAATIVSIMNGLSNGGSPATGAPVIPSNGATYTVMPGDTLSGIAAAHGLSVARLEQLNPQAGHPAGNFNLIRPGDVIRLVGMTATATTTTPVRPSYYTVSAGDNMSTIAARHGLPLGELESLNPGAGHPAGNFSDIWPGDHLRIA